jgi:hypothetical protein
VAGEGFEPSKAEPGDLQNLQSVGSGSGSDCSDLRKRTQEHECSPSKSNLYHALPLGVSLASGKSRTIGCLPDDKQLSFNFTNHLMSVFDDKVASLKQNDLNK